MKSILLIFFALLFLSSCSDDPSGIVENDKVLSGIENISFPDTVFYNSQDSTVTLSFKTENDVNAASISLFTVDGKFSILEDLSIEGNKSFQYEISFSKKYPSTKYQLETYLLTKDGTKRLAFIKHFLFIANIVNEKPEIKNINLPQSINRGELFTFSATVNDPNGISDIDNVLYMLYMPDGNKVSNSSGITDFPMFDDGQTNVNGDTNAGDGIYTSRFVFPSNVQPGTWKLEIYAQDRGGLKSDLMSKTFEVK